MNNILDDTKKEYINYFDGKMELNYSNVLQASKNFTDATRSRISQGQQGVCIFIDRGAHYIAAVIAAWRAGLYVVPLNTAWPIEKNLSIINKISPSVVVVNGDEDKIPGHLTITAKELFLDNMSSTIEKEFEPLLPSDIAYIIFTSGSTGEPKGVVISAGSFKSYIDWTSRNFKQFSTLKKLLLTSELTFDITMGDLAFSLAFGTDIGVVRNNSNIPSVLAMIMKYEIDVLYSVPTTHIALTSFATQKRGANLNSLKLILSGGDRFPWGLVGDYKQLAGGAHFYNVYGPTETTINCFSVRLDDKTALENKNAAVPIGYCFDSLDYIFVDEDGNEASEGELCIAGPQLMLGYFGDASMTKKAFVQDPRVPFVDRRLYQTGDLGYFDNGFVYLRGRKDGLVKIKGYRIHPDEISKKIDSIEEVESSAVVSCGEQNSSYLASFIKFKKGMSISEATVIDYLKISLPEYMLPKLVVFVDVFPLNQSGKIDKKKLVKEFL